MKIDEAITHAREVASRKFDDRVHCIKCAEEHKQLAEWLEDYKRLLELERSILANEDGYLATMCERIGYNRAIDDFVKAVCKKFTECEGNGIYRLCCCEIKQVIADLAEKLKAGE